MKYERFKIGQNHKLLGKNDKYSWFKNRGEVITDDFSFKRNWK